MSTNQQVSEQQFMAALAHFEGSQPSVAAQGIDLCGTYRKVKPILSGILPFLKLIPKIGAPAVAAIQALIAVLDGVCPLPAPGA